MAFTTTSLQGRSDEQRSWDLQLGLVETVKVDYLLEDERPAVAPGQGLLLGSALAGRAGAIPPSTVAHACSQWRGGEDEV